MAEKCQFLSMLPSDPSNSNDLLLLKLQCYVEFCGINILSLKLVIARRRVDLNFLKFSVFIFILAVFPPSDNSNALCSCLFMFMMLIVVETVLKDALTFLFPYYATKCTLKDGSTVKCIVGLR